LAAEGGEKLYDGIQELSHDEVVERIIAIIRDTKDPDERAGLLGALTHMASKSGSFLEPWLDVIMAASKTAN
jgi:hypothetical protein